jgi:hypothetical protein
MTNLLIEKFFVVSTNLGASFRFIYLILLFNPDENDFKEFK